MSEPTTKRLFVAIDPPEPVRNVLADLVRPIRGVAWTPPEQYHLTVRFIGEVGEEKVAGIEAVLRSVGVETFLLGLEGVGAFPPAPRPSKVLWAGTGRAHPRLFQLRQKIDDALLALGPDLDVRTFEPHFTLGRCGRESSFAAIRAFIREHEGFAGPMFRVGSFVLYRSELRPSGAVHTPLIRVPLAENAI